MLAELLLVGAIAPAIITTEYCAEVKDAAQFFEEHRENIPLENMKRMFPRHRYILHRVYDYNAGDGISNILYAECIKESAI